MSPRSPAPPPGGATRAERLALATIVAGGLALRLWGLRYGLPHLLARPDEATLMERIVGFETGDLNPHWFMYPTLSLYLLYAWLKPLLLVASALGAVPAGPAPLGDLVRTDPTLVYLLARSLSVVLGTATIALVYTLGRMAWSVGAGLAAALVLAVAYLHVRDAHFFKPDAMLACFTTATLLACVRLERRPSAAAAVLAGAACGLAIGVKYSVTLLLPLGLAAALPSAPGRWCRVVAAGTATLATVVLTSPYIVLDYRTFAGWMAYTRLFLQYGGEGVGSGFRYHAEHSLLLAHGLPFSVFALAAWLTSLRRRPLLLVNAFLAVALLQLGLASLAYTRYFTQLLPAFAVVMGVAVARLAALPGRRALVAVVLVFVLARSFANAVAFDRIVARPDTRLLARAWLEDHVPAGTAVLVLGAPWPYTFGDPVLDGYTVRRNVTAGDARYVVTHESPVPFSRLPDGFAALRPRLRLEATFTPFADTTPPPGTVFETRDAFYVPLAGFAGVVRGGPLIRVYSVAPPPG